MSRKLALIIGNNDYTNNPLKNCVNDATSLADVLSRVENCHVKLKTNLKAEDMYECIEDFTASIKRNDFIIFFFAGHGVQWGDQNFLLPCDNHKIISNDDMYRYAINAQTAVDRMAEMNAYVVLFLLDCCRNYWLSKKLSNDRGTIEKIGGLHQMKAPRQTLIAFACAAGDVVADQTESSTNGLFTKYLLKHITNPDEHIETTLRRVASDVAIATDYAQIPFRVTSIISDDVYLTSRRTSKQRMPVKMNLSRTIFSQISRADPPKKDINILLLGVTGLGKSTFINALANYLANNTPEDALKDKLQVPIPFGFSYMDPETYECKNIRHGVSDEYENMDAPYCTCTRKCRSFVFKIDDRLLRLIDTPPIGDTRGFEQDVANMSEIITYISQYEYLNTICILFRPDQDRPHICFRHSIQMILQYLPQNAISNIVFIFTNARSEFYRPGSTWGVLRRLFSEYQQEHSVEVLVSKENAFVMDNESIRYLAIRDANIQLNNDETEAFIRSWNHTVQEYARLVAYVTARSPHNVRDTVSLYHVQELISILRMEKMKLSSFKLSTRSICNPENEEIKVDEVYKKLCKYIQSNAILPFNEATLDYIISFKREEQVRNSCGAQNQHVINNLSTLYEKYSNEINLMKQMIKNEQRSINKTAIIKAEDVFPLVATLYDSPIYGQSIREQVEKLKMKFNKIEKRENFVELPSKANSSPLMLQFKQSMLK